MVSNKMRPVLSFPPEYREKAAARLEKNSEPGPNGCVVWTKTPNRGGYGKFVIPGSVFGKVRQTGAHRAAWLASVGDIPEGLQIDHLCYNRVCINVEHMELVTQQENLARRREIGRPPIDPKGHSCGKHGQAEGSVNTDRRGYRYWRCLICKRASANRRYAERKVLALQAT